jgi:hypothetical protein
VRKISCIIFLILSLCSFAQKNNNFEVNVKLKNQPIKALFSQIEKQTQLKFSYNSNIINADSTINYTAHKPVKKIISEIFNKRIQSKIIGDHIILVHNKKIEKQHEKEHPDLIEFSGTILNALTQKPINQASVYDVSSRNTALTNDQGHFSLSVEKGNIKNFNIAKTGYQDVIISINIRKENNLEILLKPLHPKLTVTSKSVKKATIQQNSNFILKMVPPEGLITVENLQKIEEKRFGQVSFIPTIGTNMAASGVIENNFSLNVLGGYNGGVDGIEIGGLFNILNRNMNGVQIAGLSNVVEGQTSGVQIAGLINKNKQNVIGLQVGGISNFLSDSMQGMQVGGISNIVTGYVDGLQIAGIHNHTTKSLNGVQISGITNWIQDSLTGLQIAGIGNITNGGIQGFQLAGIHNLSTKNITGGQVSGITNQALSQMRGIQLSLINYAKVNKGLQLGLINIADSTNGLALGLFNYVKNGFHPIEVFTNDIFDVNVAFKSGIDYFYVTYTLGMRPDQPHFFGIGAGIGTKINTWKWLSFSLDATGTFVHEYEELNRELNLLSRLDLTVDFNIKKFSIFLGPSLNYHISKLGYKSTGEFTSTIAQDPFYTEVMDDTQFQAWWGYKAGLRYSF